jgi:hypothetical protein
VNPEALYRALIDAIPMDLRVLDAAVGASHSIVVTGRGLAR